MPEVPKSMTALKQPSSTSRLPPGDIAVKPDGCPLKWRGKSGVPDLSGRFRIDMPVKQRERLTGLLVIEGGRTASVEIVIAGWRTVRGIGLP